MKKPSKPRNSEGLPLVRAAVGVRLFYGIGFRRQLVRLADASVDPAFTVEIVDVYRL